MTCIAGFVEDGSVWIGADSAGVSAGDYGLIVRSDAKLFRNGPMLFGFTTSFRMGQLLRHALVVPEQLQSVSVDKYMATTFVSAVRACLSDHGWSERRNDREVGGDFLVGYRGRLFHVCSDYQVGEAAGGIDSAGCGDHIARGALYASTLKGRDRVLVALKAAEAFSAGVRGPFTIEELREPGEEVKP